LEPATIASFNYIGCYTDLAGGITRSLSSAAFAYDPMTLESCAANCANYDFFGTEYGRECYCGYTLDPTLRATESDCNTPCSGNSSEICGTGARLSVYQNQVYIPPPSPPAHEAQSGNYSWQGCIMEVTNGGPRALSDFAYYNDTMTVEACVNACSAYTYAGIEYGRECYCGNTINPGGGPAPTTDCSFLCPGNSLEYCGAGSRL
ncbi:WSC-domain-containing protein, partial [Hyaloscypha bicolor E]